MASYLLLDVLEGRWRDDRETDKEHISLGIGERSQTIVVLLACVQERHELAFHVK